MALSCQVWEPPGIPERFRLEVSDFESARVQALMTVSELQREHDGFIEDWSGWHLHIVRHDGTLVHSFPLVKTLH
ncbi:hypothetical protein J4G37_29005 [Microvirga sp. 3-52]|nr:hypothetical protein [Microvirga sp. 3-52]